MQDPFPPPQQITSSPPLYGPPRRSAGSGCLIASLVGCGVIVMALIILGIIVAPKVGQRFHKAFRSIAAASIYVKRLQAIRTALQLYQKDHKGKYPPSLQALIPNYLPDASSLSVQLSAHDAPIKAFYHPPSPNAPGDEVVAGFRIATLRIVNNQKQTIYIDLLKDGSIVEDQFARQYLPERSAPGESSSRTN